MWTGTDSEKAKFIDKAISEVEAHMRARSAGEVEQAQATLRMIGACSQLATFFPPGRNPSQPQGREKS